MGSLPYANFITTIVQNFPKIFGLCIFRAIYFVTAIFVLLVVVATCTVNSISDPEAKKDSNVPQLRASCPSIYTVVLTTEKHCCQAFFTAEGRILVQN